MLDQKYLERQRRWLDKRLVSKQQILKAGGEQALAHSQKDVVRIVFALKRISEKQYGLCTNCGGLIGEDRLAIIPETPFCSSCAQEIEAH